VQTVVANSLDRKVCNTLNVCVVLREHAAVHAPAVLAGLDAAAAARGASARLHVVAGSEHLAGDRLGRTVTVRRAAGPVDEPAASVIPVEGLATEWEWEDSPEISLVAVADLEEAIALCNRHSPRFVASLLSADAAEHERFYAGIDAPFVGDGFTRWVDGQYALQTPELGLSNWEHGRSLGRGAILSGDSVHTIRYRARVVDHSLRR
jgi:glutamate-5-semialdehyde dehydrogenase